MLFRFQADNLITNRYQQQVIAVNDITDKTKILSSVVYLANMSEKDLMNEAWMAWMDPKHPPARAAVGVELTPSTLVEIMCVATK